MTMLSRNLRMTNGSMSSIVLLLGRLIALIGHSQR